MKQNSREEIVSLLRGFFVCPLITELGKKGVLDVFLKESFTLSDIPNIVRSDLMKHILDYLESLNLIEKLKDKVYVSTKKGKSIFMRWGSFALLYSYREMIQDIEGLLYQTDRPMPKCNRKDNVIGSGLTNGRKFFPAGLDSLRGTEISVLIDLACGDGEFLSRFHQSHPRTQIICSDLSKVAIDATKNKLNKIHKDINFDFVQTDAVDLENWVPVVEKYNNQRLGVPVISMWYLVHEISQHRVDKIVNFFEKIFQRLPNAHLLIGEIVNLCPQTLQKNYSMSIMPEFLLFHQFSGQGVLTWSQFQELKQLIPYNIVSEANFDMVSYGASEIPSAIVWHLEPRNKY